MLHIARWSLLRPVAGLGSLALMLTIAVGPADGAVAVLDPSFGVPTSGIVTTSIGTSAAADAVVVQPDGKIVAAGGAAQADTSQDFALARYEPGGSLDKTFGSGGIVQTPSGVAGAIALQPDGKIVAAGGFGGTVVVARYLSDGRLDSGFGTAGVSVVGGALVGRVSGIGLDPDGRIFVAGAEYEELAGYEEPMSTLLLARFNPDERSTTASATSGSRSSAPGQARMPVRLRRPARRSHCSRTGRSLLSAATVTTAGPRNSSSSQASAPAC